MPGMAAGAAGKIPGSKFDPEGDLIRPHPEYSGRVCYHLLSCDFKYWNMAAGQSARRTRHKPHIAPLRLLPYIPLICWKMLVIWAYRGAGIPACVDARGQCLLFFFTGDNPFLACPLFCYFSKSNAKALLTAGAYQKCLAPCGAYSPNRSACVPVRSNLNSFPTCLYISSQSGAM